MQETPIQEDVAVLAWRRKQFLAVPGCSEILAETLALASVDYHVFTDMVAAGCSAELAAEILS